MRKGCAGYFFIALFLLGSVESFAMARKPPSEASTSSHSSVLAQDAKATSLKFEDFIRLALARSEEIKSAREDIKIARAKTFQAMSEAIGDGDFVMTHNFQEEQGGTAAAGGSNISSTFNAAHRRERKFVFSQPLFQGFKSVGALLGAGSLKGQREGEFEYSREVLFVNAAEAFYALLAAEKNLEILDKSRKLFEERVQELQDREKIGRSRPGEVAMARSKKRVLEARIARARAALLSAQSLTWFYSGAAHLKAEDEDPETFSETLEIDPSRYHEIAERRADVAAARDAASTAKQAIVVKQSEIWPKVSLDANQYERREGFQDGISWDALIKINVPLYRGGDNIGQVLEAKSSYRKAQLAFELTRKKAVLEIEQTHQNWIASREQQRAYQAAVEASQENFDYQKEDYAKNLVSNLDVLAALEELLNVREEANQVQYEMKTNYWKLQMATSSRIPEWAENKAKN